MYIRVCMCVCVTLVNILFSLYDWRILWSISALYAVTTLSPFFLLTILIPFYFFIFYHLVFHILVFFFAFHISFFFSFLFRFGFSSRGNQTQSLHIYTYTHTDNVSMEFIRWLQPYSTTYLSQSSLMLLHGSREWERERKRGILSYRLFYIDYFSWNDDTKTLVRMNMTLNSWEEITI